MADIQVLIEVIGNEDMNQAIRLADRLEKEYKDLDRAFNKNKISAQQYAKGIQQVDARVKQLTNTSMQVTKAQSALAMAAQTSQKAMHRNGVVMQQAGYQVGDFLVQVQSGTNAFVAFGQQATQLVGVMGMLNPALIGLSAGLGIAIPLLTAVGAYFMRTRDGAGETETAVDKLSESLSKLEQASSQLSSSLSNQNQSLNDLQSAYGDLSGQAKRLYDLQVQLDEINAKRQSTAVSKDLADLFGVGDFSQLRFSELEKGIDSYEASIAETLESQTQMFQEAIGYNKDLEEQIANTTREFEQLQRLNGSLETLAKNFGIAGADAKGLAQQLVLLQQAEGPRQQAEAMIDLADYLQKATNGFTEGNDQAYGMYNRLLNAAAAALDVATNADGITDSLSNATGQARQLSSILAGIGKRGAEGVILDPRQAGYDPALARAASLMLSGDLYDDDEESSASGGGGTSEYDKAKNALNNLIASYDEAKAMALKVSKAEEVLNNAYAQGIITLERKGEVLEEYKKSLEDAKNPMVEFGRTMKDTIGNAFMSIIDGTKTASEAFRDMARAIIKEAFKMLVIKPLMTFLFGESGGGGFFNLSSFQANGGAWRGGNVTAFADGGVVGGPTYFPMSGGRTGLMGEAGPEAIMPLKRGPDGKLGVQSSGSSVVVNQTINVSTGVQQTVRTEVKSLMPQIADAAKAAVVDARRRGEMGMA